MAVSKAAVQFTGVVSVVLAGVLVLVLVLALSKQTECVSHFDCYDGHGCSNEECVEHKCVEKAFSCEGHGALDWCGGWDCFGGGECYSYSRNCSLLYPTESLCTAWQCNADVETCTALGTLVCADGSATGSVCTTCDVSTGACTVLAADSTACGGAPNVCCSGLCVYTDTAVAHCGGCGNACGTGEVCAGGTCCLPAGGSGVNCSAAAATACCAGSVCHSPAQGYCCLPDDAACAADGECCNGTCHAGACLPVPAPGAECTGPAITCNTGDHCEDCVCVGVVCTCTPLCADAPCTVNCTCEPSHAHKVVAACACAAVCVAPEHSGDLCANDHCTTNGTEAVCEPFSVSCEGTNPLTDGPNAVYPATDGQFHLLGTPSTLAEFEDSCWTCQGYNATGNPDCGPAADATSCAYTPSSYDNIVYDFTCCADAAAAGTSQCVGLDFGLNITGMIEALDSTFFPAANDYPDTTNKYSTSAGTLSVACKETWQAFGYVPPGCLPPFFTPYEAPAYCGACGATCAVGEACNQGTCCRNPLSPEFIPDVAPPAPGLGPCCDMSWYGAGGTKDDVAYGSPVVLKQAPYGATGAYWCCLDDESYGCTSGKQCCSESCTKFRCDKTVLPPSCGVNGDPCVHSATCCPGEGLSCINGVCGIAVHKDPPPPGELGCTSSAQCAAGKTCYFSELFGKRVCGVRHGRFHTG